MTDNMALWDTVSKTNPANTKHVDQRGGFTAINAHSQIMEATRQFGPIGIGWGYETGTPFFHDTLMFVPVTLWHGDRSNTFGPLIGCEEWKDNKNRVDSDVGKKATTDALTKGLSQLGFNADVFLGLYDDQKYVAQVRAEFAAAQPATDDKELAILNAILGCETLPALATWWAANWAAVPKDYRPRVQDAKETRKLAIEAMDRMAA